MDRGETCSGICLGVKSCCAVRQRLTTGGAMTLNLFLGIRLGEYSIAFLGSECSHSLVASELTLMGCLREPFCLAFTEFLVICLTPHIIRQLQPFVRTPQVRLMLWLFSVPFIHFTDTFPSRVFSERNASLSNVASSQMALRSRGRVFGGLIVLRVSMRVGANFHTEAVTPTPEAPACRLLS